ncbi:MAG: hypothetical protein JSV58_01960, partial [Candidatus Bathyarchaeota archaeon]
DQARAILQAHRIFSVRLPRLNVFSEVVLVEVHDDGRIGELNKGLQTIPEARKMKFDYPILLSHISIAQFRSDQGFDRLIRALDKMRTTDFGELRVDKIDLIDAHWPWNYPTLKTIETFELR